jgi:beta-barrel assembly-enhancing protease
MSFTFGRARSGGAGRSSIMPRLIIAGVIVVISLLTYFGSSVYNPVTNETQHIDLTVDQEIALGLQAAPEMAAQHGGLHPDQEAQALVDEVGQKIVAQTAAGDTDYKFDFHLLADEETINAFALPGGPVFITAALLERLKTEGQLAGVLGHEIGHVVARHSAEHIAKARLTEGLTGAAVIAAYDPDNPQSSQQSAAIAAMIGQLVNMRFGREDELESDRLGVRFMAEAGYDPRSMVEVMKILAEASEGQGRPPEFFSTHPNPDRRIERIQAAIAEEFPNGVPEGLIE